MNRMYDLDFEQKGNGTIRLKQNDCGEDSIIDAHPEQLRFIVRCASGMDASTAAQVEDLERRLCVLTVGLEEFVIDSGGEILNCCHNGAELFERLDGLLNLALEFSGRPLAPDSLRRGPQADTSDASGGPADMAAPEARSAAKSECAKQLGLDV